MNEEYQKKKKPKNIINKKRSQMFNIPLFPLNAKISEFVGSQNINCFPSPRLGALLHSGSPNEAFPVLIATLSACRSVFPRLSRGVVGASNYI